MYLTLALQWKHYYLIRVQRDFYTFKRKLTDANRHCYQNGKLKIVVNNLKNNCTKMKMKDFEINLIHHDNSTVHLF